MAYSYIEYVGDGTTKTFNIPFTYLKQADVKVYVGGTDTAFTFTSASVVSLATAPASGVVVRLARTTDASSRAVDFQDGSVLSESDLDTSADQVFKIAQEAIDKAGEGLFKTADGLFDAQSRRIKNVADPVNDQDAVTKKWAMTASDSQVQQATSQASAAASSAAQAAASQSSAATSAATATTKAGEASTSATNAASSASTASTKASEASSSATTATTKAGEASASATTATTKAGEASTSATSASGSAAAANNSASNAASSASTATTKAGEASTSASNAANSATSAATSATSASNSATNAQTSATNAASSASSALAIYGNTTAMNNAVTSAQNSATSAGTSATNAANSATSASTSASTATTQANTATAKATEAANSASAASSSSSSASSSATNAATSATNAASSASQAASSAASAAAIVTGVSSNRPSVRPSLLLDFANTKKLDPRVTFTRATTGTYYDGKTSVKAEENLLPNSQVFTYGSFWTNASVTVTGNSTTAPDGTTTANTVTANATTANAAIYQAVTIASGSTISIYAKAGTCTILGLTGQSGGDPWANFDLSAGTVLISSGCTASISSVGNGWYRCILGNVTTAGSYVIAVMKDANTAINPWGTGNVTSGKYLYLWGAQVEQRSTVTAYTPTTSSPITNYIPALQTATYNDARFDHDPVTGESKGLLIEEQRTNLLTSSNALQAYYSYLQNITITGNAIIAPDGTQTGAKLVEASGNNQKLVAYIALSLTAGTYTYSIYAKAGGRNWFSMGMYDGAAYHTYFDLANGVVGTNPAGNTATITPVGNGWYRCSITRAYSSSVSQVRLYTCNADNSNTYTGDGFSGVYIWGHQVETGSFATSYIPTGASQVTRAADAAQMTGTNFSSWYRAGEGSAYLESTNGASFGLWQGTNLFNYTNFWQIGSNSAVGVDNYITGNNFSANQWSFRVIGSGTQGKKFSCAFKGNDAAGYVDGTQLGTDSSVIAPANIDSAILFVNGYGYFKRIAYYPQRLSNTELQGLTS